MRLILLIFTLFYCISAQSQIAWERPYGGPRQPVVNDIIQTPGNFFYACGKDTMNSISRGLLAKFDSVGNMLWEKHYSVQDSDISFDRLLLLDDSTLIIQSAAFPLVNGLYPFPKIIKMDTTGHVIDSVWTDISSVYNAVSNIDIHLGANHTFWALTYIGTIGVSNEIQITRRNDNMNSIYGLNYGDFYGHQYSFNSKGEMAYDEFVDEFDTVTHETTNPDHVALYDSAGSPVIGAAYLTLPPSKQILRREDGGFNLFYNQNDTLVIRHFDANGILLNTKNYNLPFLNAYPPIHSAGSGYYLVTGYYDLIHNLGTTTISKFDNSDDTLWTAVFTRPYVTSFKTIKPTSDGGAIALFSTDFYTDSTNYFVRLGPNGERFPFSLLISPNVFCLGDTVSISTLQPAATYLWNTGDTTPVLNVTASGSYYAIVTDTAGNTFSLHPVNVQFDTIPPVILNDVHTCQSNVHLYPTNPNAITIYASAQGYQGSNGYFSSYNPPDTMQIWIIEQTTGGCRTTDTAFIFFDDCSAVTELNATDDLSISQADNLFNIKTNSGKNISRITIYDVNGKIQFNKKYSAFSVVVDASFLTPGLYIIQCTTDENILSKKIVILR